MLHEKNKPNKLVINVARLSIVEEAKSNIYSFPISMFLPVVGFSGQFVVFKRLTHDENIVSTSEWIRINLDWMEVGVRVGSLSLKK